METLQCSPQVMGDINKNHPEAPQEQPCATLAEALQRLEIPVIPLKAVKRHKRKMEKANPPTFILLRWFHAVLWPEWAPPFCFRLCATALLCSAAFFLIGCVTWLAGITVFSSPWTRIALYLLPLAGCCALYLAAVKDLAGWRIKLPCRWVATNLDDCSVGIVLPEFVQKKAGQIKDIFPGAAFRRETLVQDAKKLDPILTVCDSRVPGSPHYAIAVWNEANEDITREVLTL